MNCSKCGIPIGPQQGICPSCGTPVQDINSMSTNNMMGVPNMNGFSNDVNGANTMNNMQGMQPMQNMNGNGYVSQNDFNPNNNMMTFMEPSNVSLATDAKRNPNNNQATTMNQQVQNGGYVSQTDLNSSNNMMMGFMEPSNVNLASDAKRKPNQGHIDPSVMASSLVNPPNTVNMNNEQNVVMDNNQNNKTGKQKGIYYGNLELPDESSKKHIPWFLIAIVLVVIMVGGIFILPQFNKLNVTTYDGDQYTLQYNANWSVDEEKEDMVLYYSDNNSRFMFNALSTFKALNSSVANDASKKDLYSQFYKAWSNLDGGELTGGTETFENLNAETLYARVDFVITKDGSVGSFYVIVSEKHDKVISFMTYCTTENKEKIDDDVLDMLETITYKKESDRGLYNEFKSGETKKYSALGYMSYSVPECWTLDEDRTKSVEYRSNIFKFVDGVSLIDIKGLSLYNAATGKVGTSYEAMKATIANSYGAIKEEKTKTIKGKVWYIVVTPDYEAGGMSFHNEFYFTMSATNKHLYYLEAYVSNETSSKKTKYFEESIEYILNSATLLKVDE